MGVNKTLRGTCSAAPAQNKLLPDARLSYCQSALVALPLKLLLAPHCLQDRVRAPRWSCMSKPWTLGSPGLESGQSGMFPPPCREGPASSPMSQDCSELGIHRWGLLSTGGEREAFSQGPQPSVNSPFFLGAPSNSTSGCLPGPSAWATPGSPISWTPPDFFSLLRWVLLCPLLGASSPPP